MDTNIIIILSKNNLEAFINQIALDGQMKQALQENKITKRIKVRRMPERGFYNFKTIYDILDESVICNIGFISEGQPYVIPITFGRKDDEIFFHGAKGSRMLKVLKTGAEICVTITIVDGIVLARSAFHHSMNYRSVMIIGKADVITDLPPKTEALKNILEHIVPGRWNEAREPNLKELNATSVFKLKISEASAKIRTGPPIDEQEDLGIKIWAGVLPLRITAEQTIASPDLNENIPLPEYLKEYKKVVKKKYSK